MNNLDILLKVMGVISSLGFAGFIYDLYKRKYPSRIEKAGERKINADILSQINNAMDNEDGWKARISQEVKEQTSALREMVVEDRLRYNRELKKEIEAYQQIIEKKNQIIEEYAFRMKDVYEENERLKSQKKNRDDLDIVGSTYDFMKKTIILWRKQRRLRELYDQLEMLIMFHQTLQQRQLFSEDAYA